MADRRRRSRVHHLYQQPDTPWRTERANQQATLIHITATESTIPSPIDFVEMGDSEWPFSKLCQEGW